MLHVQETHLAEYKIQMKVNMNTVHQAMKDKGDKLMKKLQYLEFLTSLSLKIKKHQTSESFFNYIRDVFYEEEVSQMRLEKAVSFMKSNVEE